MRRDECDPIQYRVICEDFKCNWPWKGIFSVGNTIPHWNTSQYEKFPKTENFPISEMKPLKLQKKEWKGKLFSIISDVLHFNVENTKIH